VSKQNDGGQAFPSPGEGEYLPETGMSLRDYFAGKALTAMDVGYVISDRVVAAVAKNAYRIADAMLKARSHEG